MSGLPRAKGERPIFLGDAVADDLLAMLMAVTQELAVLRERCDTQERLLVQHGVLGADEIDDYAPEGAVDMLREQWRTDYLDRVFHAFNARAAARVEGESKETYARVIDEVAAGDG